MAKNAILDSTSDSSSSTSTSGIEFTDLDLMMMTSSSASTSPIMMKRKSSSSSTTTSPPSDSGNLPSGALFSVMGHKWRKMWKRDSAQITQSDPSHKTVYLGNVVTTWAKGEGCLERPATALWKNHSQGRGSIKMLISVSPSGLKAQTREHGLTEYWANRLTYCGVPPDYPKLFCWIYRHEGRKLKQELRCHAVLCSKEVQAQRLATCLRNRLTEALYEFKKEKILRQNARLSIVQSLYLNNGKSNPGSNVLTSHNNYKPPLERSKSAPKLSCIEEDEQENEYSADSLDHRLPRYPMFVRSSSFPIPEEKEEVDEPVSQDNLKDNEENEEVTIRLRMMNNKIRNSCPPPVVNQNPEPTTPPKRNRPHTVPINLPSMTGYDKVMHLLEIPSPTREREDGEGEGKHGDEEEEEEDRFSDPVAGSLVSEGTEDSSTSHRRLHEGEDYYYNNYDNVSDESGYSEERRMSVPSSEGSCTVISNNHNLAVGDKISSSSSKSGNNNVASLVVYDNLCFEI